MYLFTSPKNKNLTAEICEVFVTSLFSIPVIYQEKICGEWVQTRGYLACVVGMPIPLRICLVETPTSHKVFSQQITEAQNVKHLLTYSFLRCTIVLRA